MIVHSEVLMLVGQIFLVIARLEASPDLALVSGVHPGS